MTDEKNLIEALEEDKNSFAKNEFLQYMYSEFTGVYNNSHSRELLENVVDYCVSNIFDVKDELVTTLETLIPEIKRSEIIQFVNLEENYELSEDDMELLLSKDI